MIGVSMAIGFAAFILVLIAAGIALGDRLYSDARAASIARLDELQGIYATQAAQGIERHFSSLRSTLESLAGETGVVVSDPSGQKLMELFYKANSGDIRSVTRTDARGRIVYTLPDGDSIGKDISDQAHVRELLRTQRAVVSDVFISVQGDEVVAMHVPVRSGAAFAGSLAITLDFRTIAKSYVECIRIGETGYAWMISRDGTELYCPVPGHTGRSVFETSEGFPSIISMANEMIEGKSGSTDYTFDMIMENRVERTRKRASYRPIDLGGNFWSIVVASSEDEALSALSSFRRGLAVAMAISLAAVAGVGARALVLATEKAARKRSEAALERERRFNEAIVQSSPAFIVAVGYDGRVIMMNRSMRDELGYGEEETVGADFVSTFIPEEERDSIRGVLGRAIGIEGPSVNRNRILAKDGRMIDCEWRGMALRGAVTGDFIIGIGIDVTQRLALEEKLRQSQKMESIGRLAGGVAHDFNNMLSVIIGAAEMARAHIRPDDPMKQYIDLIDGAAERSATITRQLLAFSRKEAAMPRLFDLNARLRESMGILRRLMPEDVRISFLPADGPMNVLIDPSQLDQIVVNLAANSRDAMPNGGEMRIRTAVAVLGGDGAGFALAGAPGEYVELEVADDGIGMDAETLSHVFEPFFTTKPTGRGTGLGLPMVYGVMHQNGGAIRIESLPGKGSSFSLYFPRREGGAEAIPDEAAEEKRINATVLVVEDEPMVLEAAALLLTQLGCSVIRASGPEEGIAACERLGDRIDVVLTDLSMPGMNGKDMAAAIRRSRPGMRIVFMSGYGTEVIAQRGMLDEGIDFIPKPLTARALGAKLAELLSS